MKTIAIFTTAMISTAFCVAQQQPNAAPQKGPGNLAGNEPIRRDELIKILRSGTYISGKSRITLRDGFRAHHRIKKDEDAGQTTLLTETVGIAKSSVNGGPDAVVLLGVGHGGNEILVEMHAVRLRDGKVQDLAVATLGANVAVRELSIEGNVIHVQQLVHGEDDPRCCPSQREDFSYILKGTSLVPIGIGTEKSNPHQSTSADRNALSTDEEEALISLMSRGLANYAIAKFIQKSFMTSGWQKGTPEFIKMIQESLDVTRAYESKGSIHREVARRVSKGFHVRLKSLAITEFEKAWRETGMRSSTVRPFALSLISGEIKKTWMVN